MIQQQANTTLSSVLDLQREHRSLDLSRASGAAAAASAASRSALTASAMEALVAFLSPSERRSLRMLRSSVSDRRSSMWKLPRVLKDSWRWRLSNCFRVIPGKKHHVLWPTAATRTGNRTRPGEGMRRCQLRLAIRASCCYTNLHAHHTPRQQSTEVNRCVYTQHVHTFEELHTK